MSRFIFIMFASIALSQSVFADFTIHVLSPWKNDNVPTRRDSLRMVGNSEAGYYPGSSMYGEGGGWFYFTYKTLLKTDWVSFNIVDWTGPSSWQGYVSYPRTFRADSLFAQFPLSVNELWIVINDTTQPYQVYSTPPHGKVIYLFNPWPNNSSQISIDNRPPMKMQSRTDLCGWYTCYYVGPSDSLYNVYFTDYFHTQKYLSSGLVNWAAGGTPLDLRTVLGVKDTVYILPTPFPYGPPLTSATFPGQTGDCGLRTVSGIFRDWKLDNISFFNDVMGAHSGGKGIVQTTLLPPDYKPQLTAAAAAASPANPPVSTWYQTYTFPNTNGRRTDTCIDLTLKKSDDGKWSFNSDDIGGFFPLDSFNDPNNIKYWNVLNLGDSTKAGSKKHNYHFSMEMHLQFVYYQNAGLVFDFTGDDDLWIFVNNHLAVDLGGLNNRVSDTFDVDKRNISLGLGLANGQTYNMDIFYAERNPIGSNLIIQTTLDLQNSAQLFYVATVLGPGKTQYLITEHVQSMEKTCGFTPLVNRIDTPTVNFFIQGPQFAKPMLLAPGSYFNKGVTVDISKTKVTLDSTTLDTSLLPGIYHISFTSTFDSTRTGYLVFTVPPLPPNHLDILNDSLTLNPSQDAMLDSVFIAMDQPTTQVYAVLRDKLGNYTAIASGATWLSRDTSIVTVGTFPGDKSRCIITKTGTGSTWVVVSQAGLKPDSVRVSAIALPKYPIISSAVMQDTNADLIPDMVSITLNDTFKVNQQLDSIIISYRGTTYAIAAAKAVVNGVSIKAPVTPTTGIDCRPTGQVTMVLTADGASKRYSKPFTDGVDPAIISANVMENDNTGADTLFVTFSEPIPASAISGNQLLLIKAASGDTLSLTITQALKQTNDSSFTIQVTSSGLQPKAGDRLRLLPGSQGGTIVDQSKNTPHDLNRSVLLGLRLGPTAIVNTWYRDDNADGVIDQVIINFKRPVQAASFKTITAKWDILPSIVLDTVSLSGLQKINDSSYSMPVHGEKAMPGRLSTDVAMELLVDYTDFPDLPPRSALVADSAGPVLVSAKLVYGNTLAADSSRFDILTTSFSENVKPITDSHPFLLQSMKDGKQYQLRLTPLTTSNGTCTFKVDTIEAGLEPYAAKGDSMWIDVKALVTDAKGNAQINPVNRRVALDVVMKEPDWLVQAVPNPFSPAQGLAEITVGSKTPVMNADEYTLSIAIFDVVGNMVITLPLKPKNKGWAVPWDGRNKNGRSVSSGVYLGIVNVLHNNALVATKRIKIGVKR